MTPIAHQALTAAVATWLAILAAFFLHLEIPWWSGISAWIVISADQREVLKKGLQQGIGTILAAFIGYFVAVQTQGSLVLQLLIIIFASSLGIYMRHVSNAPFAWLLGLLLFLALIVESIINPAALLTTALYRCYEMLTGTVMAAIVALTLGQWGPRGSANSSMAVGATAARKRPDERSIAYVSLFGSAVTVAILIIWDNFDLPNIVPVLISVLMVSAPDIQAMRAMAFDRAIGCIAGGAAGILIVALGVQSLWTWSLALLFGLYLAGNLHNSGKPHAIAGTLAGVVLILCMVGGDGPQSSLLPAIDVVFGITFASFLLWLLLLVLEPWVPDHGSSNADRKRLPDSRSDAAPRSVEDA